MAGGDAVKVVVRVRPFNIRESRGNERTIIEIEDSKNLALLKPEIHGGGERGFVFDQVVPPSATQEDVYEVVCDRLVSSARDGYNQTIFAYGQTGSGKTYTMMGGSSSAQGRICEDTAGLIPRISRALFSWVEEVNAETSQKRGNCKVECSFIEIYNETVRDLLNPSFSQSNTKRTPPPKKRSHSYVKVSVDRDQVSLQSQSQHARHALSPPSRTRSSTVASSSLSSPPVDGDEETMQSRRRLSLGLTGGEEIPQSRRLSLGHTGGEETPQSRRLSLGLTAGEETPQSRRLSGGTSGVAGSKPAASAHSLSSHGSLGVSSVLRVREHPKFGPYVQGLSKLLVSSSEELELLLLEGSRARAVAATNMNAKSSRSHAIFTIKITQTMEGAMKKVVQRSSSINLVDLAGSERVNRSGVRGDRLKEAASVNKSLSALGNVISVLASLSKAPKGRRRHIPYRDSVLTWLLKESLGGNAKTVMVATLSPSSSNYEETLSTLRYATHTKQIVNNARVNEDEQARMIKELAEEVARLKVQLNAEQVRVAELAKQADLGSTHAKRIEELEGQLAERQGLMEELGMSWEEKEKRSQRIRKERETLLTGRGVAFKIDRTVPRLVNLSDDAYLSGCLVFFLAQGTSTVGRPESGEDPPNIALGGRNISPLHCLLCNEARTVTLHPRYEGGKALTFVNGELVRDPIELRTGDRIIFGNHHVFRFYSGESESSPEEACKTELDAPELFDFQSCIREVEVRSHRHSPSKESLLKMSEKLKQVERLHTDGLRRLQEKDEEIARLSSELRRRSEGPELKKHVQSPRGRQGTVLTDDDYHDVSPMTRRTVSRPHSDPGDEWSDNSDGSESTCATVPEDMQHFEGGTANDAAMYSPFQGDSGVNFHPCEGSTGSGPMDFTCRLGTNPPMPLPRPRQPRSHHRNDHGHHSQDYSQHHRNDHGHHSQDYSQHHRNDNHIHDHHHSHTTSRQQPAAQIVDQALSADSTPSPIFPCTPELSGSARLRGPHPVSPPRRISPLSRRGPGEVLPLKLDRTSPRRIPPDSRRAASEVHPVSPPRRISPHGRRTPNEVNPPKLDRSPPRHSSQPRHESASSANCPRIPGGVQAFSQLVVASTEADANLPTSSSEVSYSALFGPFSAADATFVADSSVDAVIPTLDESPVLPTLSTVPLAGRDKSATVENADTGVHIVHPSGYESAASLSDDARLAPPPDTRYTTTSTSGPENTRVTVDMDMGHAYRNVTTRRPKPKRSDDTAQDVFRGTGRNEEKGGVQPDSWSTPSSTAAAEHLFSTVEDRPIPAYPTTGVQPDDGCVAPEVTSPSPPPPSSPYKSMSPSTDRDNGADLHVTGEAAFNKQPVSHRVIEPEIQPTQRRLVHESTPTMGEREVTPLCVENVTPSTALSDDILLGCGPLTPGPHSKDSRSGSSITNVGDCDDNNDGRDGSSDGHDYNRDTKDTTFASIEVHSQSQIPDVIRSVEQPVNHSHSTSPNNNARRPGNSALELAAPVSNYAGSGDKMYEAEYEDAIVENARLKQPTNGSGQAQSLVQCQSESGDSEPSALVVRAAKFESFARTTKVQHAPDIPHNTMDPPRFADSAANCGHESVGSEGRRGDNVNGGCGKDDGVSDGNLSDSGSDASYGTAESNHTPDSDTHAHVESMLLSGQRVGSSGLILDSTQPAGIVTDVSATDSQINSERRAGSSYGLCINAAAVGSHVDGISDDAIGGGGGGGDVSGASDVDKFANVRLSEPNEEIALGAPVPTSSTDIPQDTVVVTTTLAAGTPSEVSDTDVDTDGPGDRSMAIDTDGNGDRGMAIDTSGLGNNDVHGLTGGDVFINTRCRIRDVDTAGLGDRSVDINAHGLGTRDRDATCRDRAVLNDGKARGDTDCRDNSGADVSNDGRDTTDRREHTGTAVTSNGVFKSNEDVGSDAGGDAGGNAGGDADCLAAISTDAGTDDDSGLHIEDTNIEYVRESNAVIDRNDDAGTSCLAGRSADAGAGSHGQTDRVIDGYTDSSTGQLYSKTTDAAKAGRTNVAIDRIAGGNSSRISERLSGWNMGADSEGGVVSDSGQRKKNLGNASCDAQANDITATTDATTAATALAAGTQVIGENSNVKAADSIKGVAEVTIAVDAEDADTGVAEVTTAANGKDANTGAVIINEVIAIDAKDADTGVAEVTTAANGKDADTGAVCTTEDTECTKVTAAADSNDVNVKGVAEIDVVNEVAEVTAVYAINAGTVADTGSVGIRDINEVPEVTTAVDAKDADTDADTGAVCPTEGTEVATATGAKDVDTDADAGSVGMREVTEVTEVITATDIENTGPITGTAKTEDVKDVEATTAANVSAEDTKSTGSLAFSGTDINEPSLSLIPTVYPTSKSSSTNEVQPTPRAPTTHPAAISSEAARVQPTSLVPHHPATVSSEATPPLASAIDLPAQAAPCLNSVPPAELARTVISSDDIHNIVSNDALISPRAPSSGEDGRLFISPIEVQCAPSVSDIGLTSPLSATEAQEVPVPNSETQIEARCTGKDKIPFPAPSVPVPHLTESSEEVQPATVSSPKATDVRASGDTTCIGNVSKELSRTSTLSDGSAACRRERAGVNSESGETDIHVPAAEAYCTVRRPSRHPAPSEALFSPHREGGAEAFDSPMSVDETERHRKRRRGDRESSPLDAAIVDSPGSLGDSRGFRQDSASPSGNIPQRPSQTYLGLCEREGWMTKQGGFIPTWRRRWFVLKDGVLFYFADPNAIRPKGVVSLDGASVYIETEAGWSNPTLDKPQAQPSQSSSSSMPHGSPSKAATTATSDDASYSSPQRGATADRSPQTPRMSLSLLGASAGDEVRMQLVTTKRTYFLIADSASAAIAWYTALSTSIVSIDERKRWIESTGGDCSE
eukprot:Rmarinus@m.24388